MKWEHKIGIGITCTFLCLIGAVIGLKMQEQTPPESSKVAAADPVESTPETSEPKSSISFDDLGMPPLDPPPAPQANASGDPPRRDLSPDNRTKANEPSQKNAMKSVRGDVPTASAGTNGTPIVSAAPPLAVESPPTARPVKGADEWGQSSSQSKEKKSKSAPAAPISDLKPASSSLPLSPEAKKQQPPNQPASSVIVPAGSIEPALEPLEPQKPVAAPPSPPTTPTSTRPGTVSPPTPPVAANSTNSAPPPAPAMPPFLSQQPTNAPKAPDPKEKEKAPLLAPIPAPVKSSEMPPPSAPPAQPPAPAATPAIVSPTPAAPAPVPAPTAPPPLPAPTAPPPSTPAPGPVIISGPTATPAPTPPASSPPPPPKPPTDGSTFIPANPPAASGPVGVNPAPLPLPVMPPSSPLASASDKPLAPQPASNRPSVTVYDEQDYSCRPGDTWEGVSKQFYMTDRYAKALQRHNQNHARASERMKDSGQLAAGERIFVPQSYVLEERYADAIVKPAAAPASTTMPVVYPSGSPATPAAPLPPMNGAAPPPKP